jgi:hypothetical protein
LKARTEDPAAPLSGALAKASSAILGTALEYTEPDLQRIMSPKHFVEVRKTHGGPAPSETGRAIAESAKLMQRDRDAWSARRARLNQAESALEARARAL